MQLKSLELFGFKSFADRTKLSFDKGVTGIVGPNGCGKSNIIDAIRWVLGEQSMKNLRSDKMEEVIFNGNEKRKRSNFAEVSITFENTKNLLPTEYSTLTITRKLFREGGSEYYLNDVPCRLKDIESLLMDTGIGPDSYAIIELKMVDELLNDKHNTRRELFDEAAGISKYKLRKKETLKRLETVEQDLVRLEDILQEIEKNLKNLEKQAKKTEKFFELKKEYFLVSSRYVYLKSQAVHNQEQEYLKAQNQKKDQIVAIKTQVHQIEASLQQVHKELLLQEELLVDKQKNLNQITEQIQALESERKLLREREKFLAEKIEGLHNAIRKAQNEKDSFQGEMEKLESRLDELNEQYDKIEYLLQEIENELAYNQNQEKVRKLQLEELLPKIQKKSAYLHQIEKNLSIQKLKLETIEQELQKNREQKELKSSNYLSHIQELENQKRQLRDWEEAVSALQAELEKTLLQERALQEHLENQKKQFQELQLSIGKKKNEYQLLKSLLDNLEGYPDSIKFLVKKRGWSASPVLVSDIFTCPEEYKVALELYLEPYLHHFVVRDYAEAFHALDLLNEKKLGKASFFILEEIEKYLSMCPPENLGISHPLILDFLQYDAQYKPLATYLFQNVYLIDHKEAVSSFHPKATYLVKTGNWIYNRAQISGGSIGLFEGKKIGRKKDLENLEKAIQEGENTLSLVQQNLKQTQLDLANLPIKSLENQIKAKNQEILKVQKEISILEFKLGEYKEFIEKADSRKAEIENEYQKLKAEIAQNTSSYEVMEEEYAQIQEVYEAQNKQYRSLVDKLNEQQKQYNQTNLQFLEIKNQVQAVRQEIKFKRESLQKNEENLIQWKEEIQHLELELQELHTKIADEHQGLVDLYEQKEFATKHLTDQEQIVRALRGTIQRYEAQIRDLRSQKENLEKETEALGQLLTEIKIQANAIAERFQVEFNTHPSELKKDDLWENEDLPAEEEVYQQMMELRSKLQNFGEINPMALEAYQEIKERYDFMIAQRTDVLKAKQDLLQTLEEMDRNAKEQFEKAFHTIRENFIRVFHSLFAAGDTCDLVLVDPANPVESPIEIIAKPKGKKPLTINQLSGGEKTLTATSLLFAIYLFKPAPFCIFDEVDAPLDDANLDKFNRIIREFSKESQFILVTHNKRTMLTTEVIYGVTMEEMGVSRVLPVSLVDLKLV